jgi:hypothetical protein
MFLRFASTAALITFRSPAANVLAAYTINSALLRLT